MDIFEPINTEEPELPVIVNIHGGALIEENKNFSVGFCRQLAKRGYLVCSLEYWLVPAVRVYEQFDDVCAGMDCIGRKLVDFNVDFTRIYLVAESAGAYLATYVAAMKKSKALQEAIGYEPSRMRFKAMAEYTNPEHPEIIYNIPPCYLITSKADMLERYTLDLPESERVVDEIVQWFREH